MRFRFIDAERAGLAMPKFGLCRLLRVSVSGFHAWRNRGPSQRQLDDMVLLAHVRAAFRRSRESYGAERVHHELAENGIEVGRHGVARLMRGNGLSPKRKQKFKKTTDSQHNKAVASNLLDQNFSAEAANEKWAADISYIWTAQGWLYLAVMLDLYSRRVIGWAVGARMTSDLPLRALNRAIGLRQPGAGVIHHGDRGSQYCSDAYQARLGELGFLASMSGKGNCHDNAVVETFFKTIKSELIWRTVFMSRSVSTRDAEAVMREFGLESLSSSQVSRAAKLLDGELDAWRNRPLGEIRYLLLDARHEKVREGGVVRDAAVLSVIGIGPDQRRRVLGVSCALSELKLPWPDTSMGSIIQSVGTRRWTSQAPSNSRRKQSKRCRAPPLFLDGSTVPLGDPGEPEGPHAGA